MKLSPFVALLGACCALVACSKSSDKKKKAADGPVSVTVAPVQKVPWEKKILLVGTLLPNQQARIAAEVEGSIDKTLAEVGEIVEEDRPLAQIDTASYQGMVNLQTANLAKAEANADNQRENLERLSQLQKTGAVSPTDFDSATAAHKQAVAEVAAARAQLGSAQTALRRSLAKAPFAGAITDRQVDQGDFVRPGTVMFQIVDDSVLRFRGEIPERYSAEAKVGQTVLLKVDAYRERVFKGTVTWINPAVSPETRGVAIEAKVENPDRVLKAHFFARAQLITDSASPTLIVPVDSVVSFVGVTKVYVVEGEVAQPREIVLGRVEEDQQEILSGLKGDERVIVGGRTKVQPGSRVNVQAGTPKQTAASVQES